MNEKIWPHNSFAAAEGREEEEGKVNTVKVLNSRGHQ